MGNHDNRLFCRLDGLSTAAREQRRMGAMTRLGLLEADSVSVFDEATQMVVRSLEVPIATLSLAEPDTLRIKSAVGLSRLGLMNELAATRQLPRQDSFCTHVVDSQQGLIIDDTLTHPAFADSALAHLYSIRAYLGVPLITSDNICLGAIAVMDTTPRSFTVRDREFLQLVARWCISEFERLQSAKEPNETLPTAPISPQPAVTPEPISLADQLKVELLSQLAQELRTPLTSVMGMASVLTREIYGPLTGKQKEYLGIIHHSGQYLLSLVNEILELSEIKDSGQALNLLSVDVEMLCQQAIGTLEQAAQRREQQIRLTIEPGRRIWLLDKDKVRQMLYHLIFSVIQSSTASSVIRLHVSRKEQNLNFLIWVSHPWLGEGLPYSELLTQPVLATAGGNGVEAQVDHHSRINGLATSEVVDNLAANQASTPRATNIPHRKNLGLLLSQQLAELHGGQIAMQGTPESGYRYVISLPQDPELSQL